jgi:HEPN domain-containing protein
VNGLATADRDIHSVRGPAIHLTATYIPTRHPRGFDAGAPFDYFRESDSRAAIGHAGQVIEFVRRRLS